MLQTPTTQAVNSIKDDGEPQYQGQLTCGMEAFMPTGTHIGMSELPPNSGQIRTSLLEWHYGRLRILNHS